MNVKIFSYYSTEFNLHIWNSVVKCPNSQPITYIAVLLLLQTPVWFGRGSHLAQECTLDITDFEMYFSKHVTCFMTVTLTKLSMVKVTDCKPWSFLKTCFNTKTSVHLQFATGNNHLYPNSRQAVIRQFRLSIQRQAGWRIETLPSSESC